MDRFKRIAGVATGVLLSALIGACASDPVETGAGWSDVEDAESSGCEGDPTASLSESLGSTGHTWVRARDVERVDPSSIADADAVLRSSLTSGLTWFAFGLDEPAVLRAAGVPSEPAAGASAPESVVPGADGSTPSWAIIDSATADQIEAAPDTDGWLLELGLGGTVVNLVAIDGSAASFLGVGCAPAFTDALTTAATASGTDAPDLAVAAIQGDPVATSAIATSGADGAPAPALSWAETPPDQRSLDPLAMTPDVAAQLVGIRLVLVAPQPWTDPDSAPNLCIMTPVAWSDCFAPQSMGTGAYQLDTSVRVVGGSGFEVWARWNDGRQVLLGSADGAVTDSGAALGELTGAPSGASSSSATMSAQPDWAPILDAAGARTLPSLPG